MLLTVAPPANAEPTAQRALHTHEQFEFVAHATVDVVRPLFGADAERAWAPDWNPIFIWPEQPADQQGMVFEVAHGDRTAIWVNTCFDPVANRVQYVYVLPDIVVTVITLRLTPTGPSTQVTVTYERTALSDSANELVKNMASHDRLSGPEWGKQINEHLRRRLP